MKNNLHISFHLNLPIVIFLFNTHFLSWFRLWNENFQNIICKNAYFRVFTEWILLIRSSSWFSLFTDVTNFYASFNNSFAFAQTRGLFVNIRQLLAWGKLKFWRVIDVQPNASSKITVSTKSIFAFNGDI